MVRKLRYTKLIYIEKKHYSEHCYFSLRCDVRLSCMFVTMISIGSGITTPFTSIKFATDLVTVVSLMLPDDALLTDSTRLYLSSYFFK